MWFLSGKISTFNITSIFFYYIFLEFLMCKCKDKNVFTITITPSVDDKVQRCRYVERSGHRYLQVAPVIKSTPSG